MNEEKIFVIRKISNGFILKYDIFEKYYEDIDELLNNVKNVVIY